jgi:hypothetical protein
MPIPFVLNGKSFDLSHLNPIRAKTVAKLRASETKVAVQVEFSCHCWSRLPVTGEIVAPAYFVEDGSRELPRNRVFCEGRYELSRALPKVVRNLLESGGRIQKTSRKNVVRIEFVVPVVAGLPDVKYFVFMKLEKRTPDGAQKYIRIFIESAYSENAMHAKVDYGKPFSFAQLIGDCWEGRYPK